MSKLESIEPYPCKLPVGGNAVDSFKSSDGFICFALDIKKGGRCDHCLLFVAFHLRNLQLNFREADIRSSGTNNSGHMGQILRHGDIIILDPC